MSTASIYFTLKVNSYIRYATYLIFLDIRISKKYGLKLLKTSIFLYLIRFFCYHVVYSIIYMNYELIIYLKYFQSDNTKT